MRKNNLDFSAFLRPVFMLFPLMLGSPFFSYCLCSFNCVMTAVGLGPVFGGIIGIYTAIISALACVLMGMEYAFSGFFALQILLVSAVCTICVITKKSFYTGMLFSSVAYGIPLVLNLKTEADKAGLSISDSLTSVFSSMNTVMPTAEGNEAEMLQRLTELVVKYVKISIPSMVAICAAAGGYIVIWLVSKMLRGTVLDNGHRFSKMKLGKDSIVFGGAMLLLMFVPTEAVSAVAVNGFIVFLFMSFCCGMSLTEFLLQMKVKSPFARVVIHGVILFFGITVGIIFPFLNVIFIYILMGIMDGFVSIRKRVDAKYEEK